MIEFQHVDLRWALHLLEAALKGRVLLDVLAVLIKGGRANAAQLAAAQHRLEQVACVHRALHQEHSIMCQFRCAHIPKI